MSSQSPYEQLGVTEASSFEEIQDARNQLFAQHQDDRKQLESIEAAYDAVLMDRLRLRQEGKIKVPDRIRFPEKVVPLPSSLPPAPTKQGTAWLQRLIDTPSRTDILMPAGVLTALGALVVLAPAANVVQMALILGMGASFYFLYRKERKLGRTVLLGLLGLVSGFLVGGLLAQYLPIQITSVIPNPNVLVSVVTFFILWLVSSFLR
ncbi:CPP1-like family protein [Stenomitos frigidus]|uniref:Molecular chaperone DnaJ n=1 Tax=Stenomitos frigidus ULC18 TaxID=2107698 RepID=A0A2T1EGX1_9CYAN|nr:CPP1-like family protein [Stenomitos frigidus]PSB31953.1 molecular chaperone DnaJ [Stenomitos frigidus ULC18]